MNFKHKVDKSTTPSLLLKELQNELVEKSWDNYEPAPIEFLHSCLMIEFHKFREIHGTSDLKVSMDGIDFTNLIAKAKTATYEKYEKLNLKRIINKSEL